MIAGLPAWAVACAFVALANILAFGAFAYDKLCARAGVWRVAEADLLFFAAMGGTPGAFAARRFFRHKTRKQPFSDRLLAIAGLQLCVLAFAAVIFW